MTTKLPQWLSCAEAILNCLEKESLLYDELDPTWLFDIMWINRYTIQDRLHNYGWSMEYVDGQISDLISEGYIIYKTNLRGAMYFKLTDKALEGKFE